MNLPIQIDIVDASGKSFSFTELETLTRFLKAESKFWNAKTVLQNESNLHIHNYLNSNSFQTVINTIESWKSVISSWDELTFSSQLSNLYRGYLQPSSGYWLWSGHAFIKPWLESYKLAQKTGDAFLEAILHKTTREIQSNYDSMQGYLLAYEFRLQDESQITKRRYAEKDTFATIRNQLLDQKNSLIKDVTDYQIEITNWKDTTEEKINSWHNNHLALVDNSTIKHSKDFQDRISSWTEKIAQLEILYNEKLRFQSPATYWNTSAKKFKKQGFYWAFTLILTSLLGVAYFGNFFLAWLQGNPTTISLQSLEGALIFAVIISTFAFIIKALSKLTFSSFHLQRDSEEREQLTHLYLSLANENTVDEESRKIILQSLFSRSETGLLNKESGPIMPGIHDAVSIITKSNKY